MLVSQRNIWDAHRWKLQNATGLDFVLKAALLGGTKFSVLPVEGPCQELKFATGQVAAGGGDVCALAGHEAAALIVKAKSP